jgi:hypothetical protein
MKTEESHQLNWVQPLVKSGSQITTKATRQLKRGKREEELYKLNRLRRQAHFFNTEREAAREDMQEPRGRNGRKQGK